MSIIVSQQMRNGLDVYIKVKVTNVAPCNHTPFIMSIVMIFHWTQCRFEPIRAEPMCNLFRVR